MKLLQTPWMAVYPPLLLVTTCLGLFLSVLWGIGWGWGAYTLLAFLLLSVGDLVGRARQYHNTVNYINSLRLWTNDQRDRHIQQSLYRLRGAWCTRVVATEAVMQVTGNCYIATAYYNSLGYRWYHIFPDGTFTRQSPFLTVKFWKEVVRGE